MKDINKIFLFPIVFYMIYVLIYKPIKYKYFLKNINNSIVNENNINLELNNTTSINHSFVLPNGIYSINGKYNGTCVSYYRKNKLIIILYYNELIKNKLIIRTQKIEIIYKKNNILLKLNNNKENDLIFVDNKEIHFESLFIKNKKNYFHIKNNEDNFYLKKIS